MQCYMQFVVSVYTQLMVFVNRAHCIQTNVISRTAKLKHHIITKDSGDVTLKYF